MATLHLISNVASLDSCLATAGNADSILLIEDGVYVGTQAHSRDLKAIDDDVRARGLDGRLQPNTSVISYDDFVQLAVEHQPIVTWC